MEQFDSMLSPIIDQTLGQRCRSIIGYQYSEIIRSLMSVYFCGGSCVEDVTSVSYTHLYLHLLFHTLQQSSRFTFDAEWNAPLPIITDPIASVKHLMPDYYPRQTPRLVSCYALFK